MLEYRQIKDVRYISLKKVRVNEIVPRREKERGWIFLKEKISFT